MKRALLFLILLSLVLTSSSSAFDGKRKGFVLGLGLGIAPVITTSSGGVFDSAKSRTGLAINLLIGYAFNERDMIVFLNDAGVYSSGDRGYAQDFYGAGYYHYFGEPGNSFYLTGGFGFQEWGSEDYEDNDGVGMLIGGGYEFARHWQLHGSFSVGRTTNSWGDYTHKQLIFTLTTVAF